MVEEYGINPDGEFTLLKRKVTKKYYPPDTSAISKVQEQWEAEENLSNLSESQLLEEKSRLLAELKLGDEKRRKMKEQQNQFQEQLVADVKADFEKRRQARLSIEQAWRLNMNFMVGNQFSEINAKGDIDETCKQFYWQERSVFNHIAPIVETRLAKLSRVRSGVTVRPLTTDEQDVSAAKFSTAILNSIIAENKLPNLLNTANAWSEICGTVFYKVVWDGEKGTKYTFNGKTASDGDVSVMVVPPFEIYPESLEGDLDTQPSIMHVKAYSASEVKDLWGVDVKPQKVNVFNMQNAVVSGGFGYNSTVPNVSEEIKDDAVVVIENSNCRRRNSLMAGTLSLRAIGLSTLASCRTKTEKKANANSRL